MKVAPFDQALPLKPLIEHYSGSPTFQPGTPSTRPEMACAPTSHHAVAVNGAVVGGNSLASMAWTYLAFSEVVNAFSSRGR